MYAPHPHPQDGVPAGSSFLASPDHSSRRRAKSKGKLYSIVTNYFILCFLSKTVKNWKSSVAHVSIQIFLMFEVS